MNQRARIESKIGLKLILLFALVTGSLIIASTPALADSQDYNCPDDAAVCLCDEATGGEGETGAAEPIRIFFTILSVLGPVFATIFFVGMSVAGAAQLDDNYQQDRRRVLILGFSVPISISFLNVIGSEIVGQSIDCFFP